MSGARRLFEFAVKHWVWSALATTLPGWYGLLVRYGGERASIVDKTGAFTTFGTGAFWILFLFSLLFSLGKSAAVHWDNEKKGNGVYVLQRLIDAVNAVTKAKLQRFERYARMARTGENPFEAITQPEQQIERILDNLQMALSEICGISRDDIGLSVMCSADDGTSWRWVSRVNVENDLQISELLNNPSTSAYQVVRNGRHSIFHADKKLGIAAGTYLPGPRDQQFQNAGSILVHDVSLTSDNETLLRAVLSISTHGHLLCEDDDEASKQRIYQTVLPCFESRLRLELALHHIKVCASQRPGAPQSPSVRPS